MYDFLRGDRCLWSHAIEAEGALGDVKFVDYVMSITLTLKMNMYNKEKYLLRKAFRGEYLLEYILMRKKRLFQVL